MDFLTQLVRRRASGDATFPDGPATGIAQDNGGAAEDRSADPAREDAARSFNEKLLQHQLRLVAESNLFQEDFYLQAYPDIKGADISPLEHFFSYGFKEGRKPNPYFDPLWYLERNPDVAQVGMQPLLHFLLHGDKQGRSPGPFFQTAWYRTKYGLDLTSNTLGHYLENHLRIPLSPIPEFDADFYAAQNPDVFVAKVDLFEHFVGYGYTEYRDPSPDFNVKFYVQRMLHGNKTIHPFLHYLENKSNPNFRGRLPENEPTVSREVKRFTKPGPDFEELRGLPWGAKPKAKVLAYYLPQFHAFPENDRWWGRGFTEWTNLVRGSPRFVGHYQPRVPRDLGFYTLTTNDPVRQQIELAKAAGLFGFVFYYYWFNGKKLMDAPVDRFLSDTTLDMPFALMWANENWTRRWDGAESEVLISQDYRPEDDAMMVAEYAKHFRDPRYIRFQARPLLMIYRPGLIPETKKTIGRWREIFRDEFNEDPIMIMAQSFGVYDPKEFGLDGAIEFPPHKLTSHLPPANIDFEYLDFDFQGKIYHYEEVARVSLEEPQPDFPLIKTAVPSWDNDARRQGSGMVLTNSTPAKYEAWLDQLVERAQTNSFFGEPVVCINAWNEWCEGAYLEPDLHFGSAYLNATARAVAGRGRSDAIPKIVLCGHDAFPSGAQQLLLNIGHMFRRAFGLTIEFILLDGGKLLETYEREGNVTIISSDAQLAAKLKSLKQAGFTGAIVNTTAAARITPYAKAAGMRTLLQVHELPRIIREKHLTASARAGIEHADQIVFAAPFVRDEILQELGVEAEGRSIIMPQGSYQDVQYDQEAGQAVRAELGLTAQDKLVLGVGYADLRKGFDLFLQLWRLLQNGDAGGGRVCLVWVGGMDPDLKGWLAPEIDAAEATGTFRMAGYRSDMAAVFSAADAFVLTSREDPYPTVVMEAMSAGVPVFAFDKAGGIPDLLRDAGQGVVVPYGDVPRMASDVAEALRHGISDAERDARHAIIAERFEFEVYARRLLRLALPDLPAVSVAVPNYNYARFMQDRLGCIFQQAHPVHEVIVLDDCSKDDSLTVIPAVAREAGRSVRLIANAQNSGSVFAQWRKAAESATGEFLWIAEADDLSDRGFLSALLPIMAADPAIQIGFTDSRTIDFDGEPQWPSYKGYYATVEPGALSETAVFGAAEFAARFLAVKNLILNVSAVVWRRQALLDALAACEAELKGFRMAGDWRLYLQVLAQPGAKIAYVADPLNVHRRHANSVTHALDADRHVAEIARCHAFARDGLRLGAKACQTQEAYVAEVAEQLGASIASKATPAVSRKELPGSETAGKATISSNDKRTGAIMPRQGKAAKQGHRRK